MPPAHAASAVATVEACVCVPITLCRVEALQQALSTQSMPPGPVEDLILMIEGQVRCMFPLLAFDSFVYYVLKSFRACLLSGYFLLIAHS